MVRGERKWICERRRECTQECVLAAPNSVFYFHFFNGSLFSLQNFCFIFVHLIIYFDLDETHPQNSSTAQFKDALTTALWTHLQPISAEIARLRRDPGIVSLQMSCLYRALICFEPFRIGIRRAFSVLFFINHASLMLRHALQTYFSLSFFFCPDSSYLFFTQSLPLSLLQPFPSMRLSFSRALSISQPLSTRCSAMAPIARVRSPPKRCDTCAR